MTSMHHWDYKYLYDLLKKNKIKANKKDWVNEQNKKRGKKGDDNKEK